MSYEPEFMRRYDEFDADRRRIRTTEEWIAFRRKWLDQSVWPRKSPEQLGKEAMDARGDVRRFDGRTWARTQYAYDITPEARYELFATIANVGDPIRFPHLAAHTGDAPSGRTYSCPFCEMATREPAPTACPRCGRPLLVSDLAD